MKTLRMIGLMLICLAGGVSAEDRRPFTLGIDPPVVKTPTSPATNHSQRTQWWMFTAAWCGPCQTARRDFEGWLKQSGWEVDESPEAHVRIIDADREPQCAQAHAIRTFPTFLLMRDGQEQQRFETYPGRWELVRLFQETANATEPAAGAISVGTITGQRENVARVIDAVSPLLSEGGTLTLTWDRAGTTPALLPVGERFSICIEKTLAMTYSLKDDVLTCRFSQPYPRGRFSWGCPSSNPSQPFLCLCRKWCSSCRVRRMCGCGWNREGLMVEGGELRVGKQKGPARIVGGSGIGGC